MPLCAAEYLRAHTHAHWLRLAGEAGPMRKFIDGLQGTYEAEYNGTFEVNRESSAGNSFLPSRQPLPSTPTHARMHARTHAQHAQCTYYEVV